MVAFTQSSECKVQATVVTFVKYVCLVTARFDAQAAAKAYLKEVFTIAAGPNKTLCASLAIDEHKTTDQVLYCPSKGHDHTQAYLLKVSAVPIDKWKSM